VKHQIKNPATVAAGFNSFSSPRRRITAVNKFNKYLEQTKINYYSTNPKGSLRLKIMAMGKAGGK
jgi:hypothetical protein